MSAEASARARPALARAHAADPLNSPSSSSLRSDGLNPTQDEAIELRRQQRALEAEILEDERGLRARVAEGRASGEEERRAAQRELERQRAQRVESHARSVGLLQVSRAGSLSSRTHARARARCPSLSNPSSSPPQAKLLRELSSLEEPLRVAVTAWLIVVRDKLLTRKAGEAVAAAARARAAEPAAVSAAVKRLQRQRAEEEKGDEGE